MHSHQKTKRRVGSKCIDDQRKVAATSVQGRGFVPTFAIFPSFTDLFLLQGSSLLPLYGPWSRGTSYYATHVGTTVCCYGDCQGSLSIIGVYPRQEQGYTLSIRTRFNLPHSLDHTSRSAHSLGTKAEHSAAHGTRRGCDSALR